MFALVSNGRGSRGRIAGLALVIVARGGSGRWERETLQVIVVAGGYGRVWSTKQS